MHEVFVEKFRVPAVAVPYLDTFFTEEEMAFVEKLEKDVFSETDVARVISSEPGSFIEKEYRRGLISLENPEEPSYRLNSFYGNLDVFCVSEQKKYRALPKEARRALDRWYFEAYMEGLDKSLRVPPTGDEIMTLEETLEFIDRQERPVYLNYCDCRSLLGDCGLPTKTCITYKSGPNTFAHRGLSEAIDKERAKEVVRKADKAGLMHTVNANGICNCCGDCCYLFRGQERLESRGFWPISHHRVEFREDSCIGCGKCAKRCHFGVFVLNKHAAAGERGKKRTVTVNPELCVGCGICATECPTGSLTMKGRE